MKYKIFLILSTVLSLLFSGVRTNAVTEASIISLEEQVSILQEKIKYLQALIANLKLQKEILAESYLVMDISNNSVILEKNASKPYPIASITKLMNAVVSAENMKEDQSIILTQEMLKPQGYSPSLFLNLSVTVKNLLKASLIQSTNDAAESLSYFMGNDKFLSRMNQKAKVLGMNDTYFYDVHGLNPKNHSTATDLAKLLVYIKNNHPELFSITKDNDFWLPDPTGKMLKFKNLNAFYDLPEFVGGKTGYLKEAKESIASLFQLNGKMFAVIILTSPDRKADTLKITNWMKNNQI